MVVGSRADHHFRDWSCLSLLNSGTHLRISIFTGFR